eukprot:m.12276 g.12276  ORF g.12276 m.12276 type:complete len:731 (+) comp23948_c0_seq3:84-2276(+)
MELPFLPGNVFERDLSKTRHHKSHAFDYRNDVSVFVGEKKPGIGGIPLPGQDLKQNTSVFPPGEGTALPSWVAFDRQVLRFYAYFQEAVHELRDERYRIRNCLIYFYLEDDSIEVIEPKVKNSGIPQGTLIRRHRIPLPPPDDDKFYTVEHFAISKEISLYSRTFKITDCDQFTRRFLAKLGNKMGSDLILPVDPYAKRRQDMKESMQPLRPYEKHDTLKQFLENDRQVLRFFGIWDDTDNMFGDSRELVVHYFLADDTVEVLERVPANAGRDAGPVFLRRSRLPKSPVPLPQPGEIANRTVLNVFGPMGAGGRYILDSLKTGARDTKYYSDSDLTIGAVIDVWGRRILLCSCDDFTKHYYHTKYGVENFDSLPYRDEAAPPNPPEVAPYNGFGSEEDSLSNCLHLIPKPPRRNFQKFMLKDRHGLESNVLRIEARFETTRPIDIDRRFIISYFLSDDTLSVFEPPQRNSGIIGGKFMERRPVKKPDHDGSPTAQSYYTAQDLFIGAVLELSRYKFILINADSYALDYMEKHCNEFAVADWQRIVGKLRSLAGNKQGEGLGQFERHDPDKTGLVPQDLFKSLVRRFTDGSLVEHEIVTLARHYGNNMCGFLDGSDVASQVRDHLRQANFSSFAHLTDAFLHRDKERSGFIGRDDLLSVCEEKSVPISDEVLNMLMDQCQMNDAGQIDYNTFVAWLNWKEMPTKNSGSAQDTAHINYKKLFGDVFPTSEVQ